MTDEVASHALEMLRRIDRRLENIEGDVRDLKIQMTMVEEHLGSSIIAISGVNSRLDRLTERVEHIERRLDLTDSR